MEDNLNWLLLRIFFRAKRGLVKLSEEYNLTFVQAFTLCLLEPKQAIPMHAISDILACDASNVTNIVDRLVLSGYIERKESTSDRRINAISLTQKGNKVRQEFLKKLTERQLPHLNNLSPKEVALFKNILKKLLL